MKNETTNTRKTVLQPDGKAPGDKASRSATKDAAVSMRRRNLLKGLGAAPVVITLHSGAAMAASSTGACVGPGGPDPTGCVTEGNHDDFVRTLVDHDGKVSLPGWLDPHPGFDSTNPTANQCLISVDSTGNIIPDTVDPNRVVTISCWNSFT